MQASKSGNLVSRYKFGSHDGFTCFMWPYFV